MRNREHNEQVAFVAWARASVGTRPALSLLFAIPNGGHRRISVAKGMKAEGVRAGVPDLFLPAPVSPYSGLFLEMKVPGSYPSKTQKEWHRRLSEAGYAVAIVYGVDGAIEATIGYLDGRVATLPGEVFICGRSSAKRKSTNALRAGRTKKKGRPDES